MLRKSIVKGVNHFLIVGKVHPNFNNETIRLAKDGSIFPYYLQTEYSNNRARALQFTEALIYAIESPYLFTTLEDRNRLEGFLNAVVKYQVNETINFKRVIHRNSDIYFNILTLFMLLR